MNTTWKAVLGIILIFVFGFASGVVCSSIFVHRKMVDFLQHPGVAAAAVLEKRLTRNLDLDSNQKQQIHDLFTQNLEQRQQMQKQVQPQVRMLNRQTFMQINAVLHPDQREKFHENLAQLRKRFNQAAPNAETEDPIGTSIPPAPPATNSN